MPAKGALSRLANLPQKGRGVKELSLVGGWDFVQTRGAVPSPDTTGTERMVDNWLEFWYWRPLLCSAGFLMAVTQVVLPALGSGTASSLAAEVASAAVALDGFAVVVALTYDPKAAGMTCLLVAAATGCTLAMMLIVLMVVLRCRGTAADDPVLLLLTDVAAVSRPALQLLLVGIVFEVGAQEVHMSWGPLLAFAILLVLIGTLAFSEVVADVLAHASIRLAALCSEGDFVIVGDELLKVQSIKWRYSVCVTDTKETVVYVPNSILKQAGLVKQSKSKSHVVDVDIQVYADRTSSDQDVGSARIKEAVDSARKLLAEMGEQGFSFTSPERKVYPNQFNTGECKVFMKDGRVVARIAFECPQPGVPGPPQRFESMKPWRVQVEWFILRLRRQRAEQPVRATA